MYKALITKLVRWGFLCASGALLVAALSPPIQRWLDRRGFIPNQYRYGDLYNMSNLVAFKELDYATNTTLTEADKPAKHYPDVDLYTLGDSFTDIDTSFYAGNRNFHRWVGNRIPLEVTLDTTKKNVLVVQVIERVIQERMYGPELEAMFIRGGFVPKPSGTSGNAVVAGGPPEAARPATSWLLTRFGGEINQRIEFLVFNGRFFTWFKEIKAGLLATLFGRTAGTALSKDGKHLFYKSDADTTISYSSRYVIPDQRLDTIVDNLNRLRRHYKVMGFNEVYIFLIPNKATILAPGDGLYNRQIERIESNPRLELPVITAIDTLRRHPEWYHLGDGHWNRQGKLFWLRKVNDVAASWSEKR